MFIVRWVAACSVMWIAACSGSSPEPTAGDGAAAASGGVAGGPAQAQEPLTLHIAGDSTAAIFPPTDPTRRVGWGAVFAQFFAEGVDVNDAARSGRSSKSFIDEGHWTNVKNQIAPGDYVLIQFGHNDDDPADAARYTDPATTFRDYLGTYVGEAEALGAVPVLLTPISRAQFSGATVRATHGAYPAAMQAVAVATATPVIDMTEKTRVWLESLGPMGALPMFAQDDRTHLSAQGAPEVAALVVEGIRELDLPLAGRLLP